MYGCNFQCHGRYDDFLRCELRLPPSDLRVLGDATFVFGDAAFVLSRGTVLDNACVAALHNAGGILQFGDRLDPLHLHERIMVCGVGPDCIANLSIVNRLIAPIGRSRWIVLAMTLFTLASICMAASRSSRDSIISR